MQYHEGTLYGWVLRGTLSHYDAKCHTDRVYPRGSRLWSRWADHVHIGVNHGKQPVVLKVFYVLPKGALLLVDAPNPGCDFQ
jgi:hypothetical protein